MAIYRTIKKIIILILGIFICNSFFSISIHASDFRKLDEAISDDLVKKIAPVFGFDRDSCFPSALISRDGQQNKGLKNRSGGCTDGCRNSNFLNTSNTLYRHASVYHNHSRYTGHFYVLYFKKDQCDKAIYDLSKVSDFFGVSKKCGHRHDLEYAAIWTINGVITHASYSAHGKLYAKAYSKLLKDVNGHTKIVYHRGDGEWGTHAMRFAMNKDRHTFVTPTIVDWDLLSKYMQERLNGFDFGDAVLPCTDKQFYNNLNRFKPPGYPTFDTNGKSCQWVNRISEEKGGLGECPSGYLLRAVKCSGRYCDNKDLLCCPYKNSHDLNSRASWSPWFSEEKAGQATTQGFVGGIQCSGKYCDNMRLKFITSKDVKNLRRNHDTGWFSEERPNNIGQCAENEFVSGMKCSGRYCDRINMTCSKASTSDSR